jgi:site-specific DNA recombinase
MGKEGRGIEEEEEIMSQRTAVLYTRVSSREQEQEGFSLEAQSKLLREYAKKNSLEIVGSFEDVETAKTTGRKRFEEMIAFLKHNRTCKILVVEKTDRLYRNFRDAVTLEDLDIAIHFVKEGQVLSKDSKSQVKFMHDIRLAVARNYSENLREEVKKGMFEKAEQGTYPGRAPFGYVNNKGTRNIEVHPEKSIVAKYVFEQYATGRYSLLLLSKHVRDRWGTCISKTNLHKMLLNPFYIGQFNWGGHTYTGTQPPIIDPHLFEQAQAILHGYNRPKYRKHEIAFRGLLTCAHDDCTVTAELKKNRYVYYRCSRGRGPCELPRFREQEIAERLGQVIKDVTIPPDVAEQIAKALERDRAQAGIQMARERTRLNNELRTLRARMDAAYCDKLDGNIPDAFWQRKQAEWQADEARLLSQLSGLREETETDRMLDIRRILELSERAYFLYLTREPAEQAELLRKVLLNCSIDAVNLYPTYRKPFDLICKRAKNNDWSGREDLNLRPPGPEPGALPG